MFKELLNHRLGVLRHREGVVIRTLEIGNGIEEQTIRHLAAEIPFKFAPELLSFYREINGLKMSWSLPQSGGNIFGSIIIFPLQKSIFGYQEKIDQSAYESAFEDVLWNKESYADESISELKQHRIFESIEGEPAFVTYKPESNNAQLFYVYEEDIDPILIGFADYIQMLFQYLGAGNLREILTGKQWEQDIKEDKTLQVIATWK
jgi:hypothetical protein